MERKFSFSVGEFYHVYSRGNNKTDIFLSDTDRKRFQKLLFVCNSSKPIVFKTIQGLTLDKIERGVNLVDIGAYCLMPNHFHLLLREKQEGGTSLFMQKLATAYSMYFNKKNGRTGKLFEGVFRAKHTDTDEYLKYLFAYIHLNPVKIIDPVWKENGIIDRQKAKEHLGNYEYSSYIDYQGVIRPEMKIINREAVPEYFASAKDFDDFVNDWLTFKVE